VLGQRWVYDACGDPVYAAVLASALLGSTSQAEEFLEVDGQLERRDPSMTVTRSGRQNAADFAGVGAVRRVVDGDPTRIVTDAFELAIIRRRHGRTEPADATLRGAWSGQPTPVPLAYASAR
jgi:hypothetical protein